jgi:hypothetical protein
MGTISVAQNGPRQKVIWLIRATVPHGLYVTTITIGSITIYGPLKQDYPPHGTFPLGNPAGLPSGAVFTISGTFTPVNDDPQEFFLKCLLA